MPDWALILAYWFHMAATVIWIGGLFFQNVILSPSNTRRLQDDANSEWLERRWLRFQPLIWLSLAVLTGSGLMQMVVNPHYGGVLSLVNRWSLAIFIKHGLVIVMALLTGYQSWFTQPALERLRLKHARGLNQASQDETSLLRRRTTLSRINLTLGILVLALTAIARTA